MTKALQRECRPAFWWKRSSILVLAVVVFLFTVAQADQQDHLALSRLIDAEIHKGLAAEKTKASPLADDAEFLRRIYLDLIGIAPTAERTQAFLNSTEPNKRAKVIDDLLAHPRFGKYWAEIWTLLTIPIDSNNRRLDTATYEKWLTEHFNNNTPLNRLVYDLVTATGEIDKNGAVAYFLANASPDKMTDNVTQMFLGVKLQCAQCHNHPFVEWKRNEYWGMAAFFMKVRINNNNNKGAKKAVAEVNGGRRPNLPESAKIVPATFLRGGNPKLDPNEPYRPVLAKWITSPDNPLFAKAMVNRVWHQLFGRGLVNPVDDMHEGHPPTHPQLLAELSAQFKTRGFDMKDLIRSIVNSDTYQRTSRPQDGNAADTKLYSHASMRVLSAEQLYDSLEQILGKDRGAVGGRKAPAPLGRKGFVNFFRTVDNADPLEFQAGIPQALRLMNSGQTNVGAALNNMQGSTTEVLQKLFLTVLSRRASERELRRMTEYVARQSDARTAYGDILWALVNSTEFALNH
jgi:hypothetical protein